VSSILTSHLTQLALAFVLGAGSVVLIATLWSSRGPTGEAMGRWLDAVDDHKDDILALITVTAIIARSVIVPHSDWVSMIESGNLIWLVVAAGTGVGLSRAGKGIKLKLQSDNYTS
jgi:hypothetical protein